MTMNKVTTSGQSKLYRSADFRRHVSLALACERSYVDVAIDALLAAGPIPMVDPDLPADIAVWADAARMLGAAAGRQLLPASGADFAERICAMRRTLAPTAKAVVSATTHSFGAEIASRLRHRLPGTEARSFPAVSVSRGDGAIVLYGKIHIGGPKLRYFDAAAVATEEMVRSMTAAKRVLFPGAAVLRFAEILKESVSAIRPACAEGGRP